MSSPRDARATVVVEPPHGSHAQAVSSLREAPAELVDWRPRGSHSDRIIPSLRETQAALGRALLGGNAGAVLGAIAGDGLPPEARLAIYRNHVAATLTDALKGAFPVVCRLVDERFFAYAADRFIAAHPPSSPCLFEFGALFPEFLAGFAPCRHLEYLPDVARLEWAMARALHADDAAPLDARALAAIAPDDIGAIVFGFDPSVTLMASPWPVDWIWRANQPGANADAVVALDAGGVCLEVRRTGDEVVFRVCAPASFAFRRALHEGRTLATAAETALIVDPGFDLAAAVHALFHDDALVSFTLTSCMEESS